LSRLRALADQLQNENGKLRGDNNGLLGKVRDLDNNLRKTLADADTSLRKA
jgi:hypothetical protein